MDSLPPALLDFISVFRPLVRAEVFESFTYLLCGLLFGEAKHGTVRARVFAAPDYQPQRWSDLFRCHQLSRQALMAQLTQGVSTTLYAGGVPARLLWLADSTLTEKPFVRRVASVDLFHRTKRIVSRAKHLQGPLLCFCSAPVLIGPRRSTRPWRAGLALIPLRAFTSAQAVHRQSFVMWPRFVGDSLQLARQRSFSFRVRPFKAL
jgi:hypothetical protein